jgi:hypothetical protein
VIYAFELNSLQMKKSWKVTRKNFDSLVVTRSVRNTSLLEVYEIFTTQGSISWNSQSHINVSFNFILISDHEKESLIVKRGQQERFFCSRCDYSTEHPDLLQDHASHCTSKPRSVLLDLVLTELDRITIVRRPFSDQTAILTFHNWPFTTYSFIVFYVFLFAWGVR